MRKGANRLLNYAARLKRLVGHDAQLYSMDITLQSIGVISREGCSTEGPLLKWSCHTRKEVSMHARRRLTWLIPAIVAGAIGVPMSPALRAQTPADNTKVNARDRAPGAVTADQQKTNAADQKLTQTIRRALVQDKTLSSYAHNVKVVTQSGQVTLKGPVRSDDEKRTVEAKAVAAAGGGHVTNELSIAPPKTSKQ